MTSYTITGYKAQQIFLSSDNFIERVTPPSTRRSQEVAAALPLSSEYAGGFVSHETVQLSVCHRYISLGFSAVHDRADDRPATASGPRWLGCRVDHVPRFLSGHVARRLPLCPPARLSRSSWLAAIGPHRSAVRRAFSAIRHRAELRRALVATSRRNHLLDAHRSHRLALLRPRSHRAPAAGVVLRGRPLRGGYRGSSTPFRIPDRFWRSCSIHGWSSTT